MANFPDLISSRNKFQSALHGWYRVYQRKLPWREAPSLYKTVVSEFMLQQTQVKTVLPYFARWLVRFPDFAALAAADEADVLKHWEGLGYYSRARNLHKLARALVAMPAPPRTAAAWEELPGIGPYTSAAIASLACGDAAAVVDGNVVRVLARLTGDATAFADNGSAVKAFRERAAGLLDPAHPGEHNEAMMELGATVCLPRSPLCTVCPLVKHCVAAARGDAEDLPKIARRKTERVLVWRAWCERGGALLLHRAAAGARRLAGLHELPTAEQAGVAAQLLEAAPRLLTRKRGITHHLIEERIVECAPPKRLPSAELVWVPLAELDTVTLSGPHRRWVREILEARGSGQ